MRRCLATLQFLDASLGEWIRLLMLWPQPRTLWYTARLVTLSADEVVWFPIGALGSAYELCGSLVRTGGLHRWLSDMCRRERATFTDLLGALCLCALAEQLLKWTFRRERPRGQRSSAKPAASRPRASATWQPPLDHHHKWWLPGDVYSMPSGHTMRAAYLCQYALHRLVRPEPEYRRCLAAYVALVAWSRIVSGRHYPGDCLLGAAAGSALATLLDGALRYRSSAGLFLALQTSKWLCVLVMATQSAIFGLRSLQ